jgi:hypothetical protein
MFGWERQSLDPGNRVAMTNIRLQTNSNGRNSESRRGLFSSSKSLPTSFCQREGRRERIDPALSNVIPAKAGIQCFGSLTNWLDPGFHLGDGRNSIFSQIQGDERAADGELGMENRFGIWDATHQLKARALSFSWILPMIFILLVGGGCGKKGPPVSWQTIVPKKIADLQAIPREGNLMLQWTVPKENTDKSVLTDLVEVRILRSEGALVGGECRGCGEGAKDVHNVKVDPKQEVTGKSMSALFDDQEAGKVYVYGVVCINHRRHPGPPSNSVWVYWDHPPDPPGRVKREDGDKRVDLSWEPVQGATGYNIYRRGEEASFSTQPLNGESVSQTHYADLNVENEKKYIYSVRAVRRVVKTDVEGKGSPEIVAIPTDLIPPAPPLGLVAVPLGNGMELSWKKNREPDLLGYYVYRRMPGESEFKRLNQSPLTKEVYLDADVRSGQEYEYSVTAVDNSVRRNESLRSEEVRVKYLY